MRMTMLRLYHRGFDSVFAASVLLRTEPFGASTSGRPLCGPPLSAENFPSLSGARPATSQARCDPAGEVEGPSALRRPPNEPRYVHDNSAPGWAPASASLCALRLRQHRPQRPKRVDTLAAIVVVGVDQDDLGLLLQELQPGEPFSELALRIGVVVSLPRLVMLPPLERIPSVEPDVGDAAGGLRLRGHQALQARFVDATESQAEHFHALERSRLDPSALTELDDDVVIAQALPQPLEITPVRRSRGEGVGELRQDAAEFPSLAQRLDRLDEAGGIRRPTFVRQPAERFHGEQESGRRTFGPTHDGATVRDSVVGDVEFYGVELAGVVRKPLPFRQSRRVEGTDPVVT